MEMAPHSDIDLLYLHNGIKEQRLESVISKINTYLYDSGKVVGHSCRTIKECFRYLDDMSSYHAFLDARFLTGSKTLFEKFKTDFLEKLPVKWTKRYNEIKEEILTSRFLNEERPILLSEPNLKTDLCGLRDIQYMFWMEKSVRNLPSIGGLSILPVFQRGEIQLLQEAYDFILRVRIAMHMLTTRKTDRLDLSLQQEVAEYLGYGKKKNFLPLKNSCTPCIVTRKTSTLSSVLIWIPLSKKERIPKAKVFPTKIFTFLGSETLFFRP